MRPFRGELGPRLIQCGQGLGLLPYQVASSSIQPFGHNRHEPKSGGCAPLGGAATPYSTTLPEPMFTSVPSGILIHPAAWTMDTIDMGQKLGGGDSSLIYGGSWVHIEHKVACAEVYLHTKWHLSPSSRLATTDIGRKLGVVPL